MKYKMFFHYLVVFMAANVGSSSSASSTISASAASAPAAAVPPEPIFEEHVIVKAADVQKMQMALIRLQSAQHLHEQIRDSLALKVVNLEDALIAKEEALKKAREAEVRLQAENGEITQKMHLLIAKVARLEKDLGWQKRKNGKLKSDFDGSQTRLKRETKECCVLSQKLATMKKLHEESQLALWFQRSVSAEYQKAYMAQVNTAAFSSSASSSHSAAFSSAASSASSQFSSHSTGVVAGGAAPSAGNGAAAHSSPSK
jgi:hypothetical protein